MECKLKIDGLNEIEESRNLVFFYYSKLIEALNEQKKIPLPEIKNDLQETDFNLLQNEIRSLKESINKPKRSIRLNMYFVFFIGLFLGLLLCKILQCVFN